MGADTCDALSTRRVLRIYAVEVEGFGLQPRYHHVVSSVGTRSKQMELMQYLKSCLYTHLTLPTICSV